MVVGSVIIGASGRLVGFGAAVEALFVPEAFLARREHGAAFGVGAHGDPAFAVVGDEFAAFGASVDIFGIGHASSLFHRPGVLSTPERPQRTSDSNAPTGSDHTRSLNVDGGVAIHPTMTVRTASATAAAGAAAPTS